MNPNPAENVSAQDEIRRRSEELAALNAVAAVVNQSLDLQFALDGALEKVLEITGIETGSIYLLDEQNQELFTRAHRGVSEALLRDGDRLKVGEEFTGAVAYFGRPMVVQDVMNDPRLQRTVLREEGYRSLVSVPLKSKGRVLGVMTLVTHESRQFTLPDLQLLVSIGDVVGVAIENALLYEQLAGSEAKYRGMFENAAVGIYRTTPEGKMLEVNDTFTRLLGYHDAHSLLRVPASALYLTLADRQQWREALERRGVLECELQLRRRDGSLIWVYDVARVVRDVSGRALCYEGTVTDITERKQAEEALRRSQQQYQSLVESVSDIVFSLDLDWHVTYVNPAVEHIGGYRPQEVIGKPLTAFVHPEDIPLVKRIMARRLAGDTQPAEFRAIARDGQVRYFQSRGQYVRDEGKVVGFTGIIRDVSDSRRAEERLARMYDVVTRYQGAGLYDHAVETLAELLEMQFVFIGEVLVGEQEVQALAIYNRGAIEHGKKYQVRSMACERAIRERQLCIYPEGAREVFPLDAELREWAIESYIAAPIVDSQGGVIGVVVAMDQRPKRPGEIEARILQIVGQRIGAEIERQRQDEAHRWLQEQLFQSQKMESVGTLAGGIAHDFNNLLTGIMGFAEMTLMKLGSDHDYADYLKRILSLGGRARDLIQQLLLFSRPTRGERTRCHLRGFLEEVMVLLRRTIPENIEIEIKVTGERLMIEANPSQIQQVILNLAVNARDAMPTGGRLLIEADAVVVEDVPTEMRSQSQPGRYVRLTISDTGEGIPHEILSHIFEPFFTTKDVGKGTGLGLSVVYGIVRAHGGWVEVESDIGQGTRFHVYLPLVDGVAEQNVREQGEDVVGGDETILLVEDEPMVLEMGRNLLQMLGYRVYAAQGGREAVSLYTKHRDEIDLVLLDVVMPQMSGPKAFAKMRAVNPQAKILLVTGYSPEEVAKELMRQGADGIVQKPYNLMTLARQVRQSLDGRIV